MSRRPGDIAELQSWLAGQAYLADRGLATAIFLALSLGRPLLLEGEAGVGKTEVAKALAPLHGAELIRLQCYEGIDADPGPLRVGLRAPAARTARGRSDAGDDGSRGRLFVRAVPRRAPAAARARARAAPPVLLIDEIDRADDEFEAFLLEMLSDFRSPSPRSARSPPSSRRSSCSPRTAPVSCTTR